MAHIARGYIEEAVGVPRQDYPATHGCPFPPGALTDSAGVRLLSDREELPLQVTVLATWPEGRAPA